MRRRPFTCLSSHLWPTSMLALGLLLPAGGRAQTAPASVAEGYKTPLITAPYASTPPTIDGVIDEAEWQGAVSINAMQTVQRTVSPRQTRFWLMWDEDHLYIAMRSPLRPGERIVQALRDPSRPINVVFDDSYEICLDLGTNSLDGQPVFFQYLANFAGARYDVMHEPAVGNSRLGWTADWQPKNRLTPDGAAWEMEVAIPRQSMYRQTPLADGETISCLLARNYKRPWEQNSVEGTSSFSVSDTYTRVRLSKSAPAIHLLRVADPQAQTFGLELAALAATPTRLAWRFDSDGGVAKSGTSELPAGQLLAVPGTGIDLDRLPEKGQPVGNYRIRVTSADGATTWLDWSSARQFGDLKALAFAPPDTNDRIAIRLELNPVRDYVRVTGDFIDYDNRAAIAHCDVVVLDAAGKQLAEEKFQLDELAYVRGLIRLPGLTDGRYSAKLTVVGRDGAVLREASSEFVKEDPAQKYSWWNTQAGNLEAVIPPWTPMQASGPALEVWGRTMTVGAAGLPSQIVSQGRELLAGPATLVAELADGRTVTAAGGPAKIVSTAAHRIVAESAGTLGELAISSRVTAEFDGMYKVELTLTPQAALAVDKLRLALPLRPEVADYVYGAGEGIRSGYHMGFLPKTGDGRIWDCLTVDSQPMVVGSFIPYVWVGNPEVGLAWFADSDEGWVPSDNTPAIELVRHGEQVDLVLNLISESFTIEQPRTIVFALQASPARPLVGPWRMCTWWCGDTFDWGGGGWVYPDGKGSTIWQSRPNTTNVDLCREHAQKRQAQRFRFIPDGPERRPNVVPYFEYNTMTDAGEQQYFGEEWKASSGPLWYGKSLTDYIVWNLDDWIKSCGIDGWYLDNVRPVHCDNLDAGRGYRLPDGRVQPVYNLFPMREFFLRLRAVWHENGRPSMIVNHMTNNMILPWNAAVDVAYDGEHHVIYPEMDKDFMDFWTLERLRMCVPGTWGVNVNFMREYQGKWPPEQMRKAMRAYNGAVLLHDALPTGNSYTDRDQRALMAARDRFGIDAEEVVFIGYWQENAGLACATEKVYLAAWKRPGKVLVAVVNWGEAAEADVRLDLGRLGLPAACRGWDAEQPDISLVVAADGRLLVPVNRHDFRLIVIEPQ